MKPIKHSPTLAHFNNPLILHFRMAIMQSYLLNRILQEIRRRCGCYCYCLASQSLYCRKRHYLRTLLPDSGLWFLLANSVAFKFKLQDFLNKEYFLKYCWIRSDCKNCLKSLVLWSLDTLKGFLDTTDKGLCRWYSRVSWTFPSKVDILWRTRRYCKNEWPSEEPKYQAGPCLSNKTMTGAN